MPYKLKIDENLPVAAKDLLEKAGHDCETVFDESLGGCPDEKLVMTCEKEGRVLISLDLDMANIVIFPLKNSPGRIVLRPKDQGRSRTLALLRKVLPHLEDRNIRGALWVVDEEKIRVSQ